MNNPKRTISQVRGNIGSASFELFVNRDLNWIFRPVHQEHDFGIDGYIDIVENGEVTGASIAVQIKCGESYLSKKTLGGYRYEGSIKHLNFYENIQESVILIILNADGREGWWAEFKLSKTLPGNNEDTWWLEVPEQNKLSSKVSTFWAEIAGPVQDHSETIQKQWLRDHLYSVSTNLIYGINKKHILSNNIAPLFEWQDELTKTKEMMLAKRGKIDFWFPEWLDDERELYQIPEVRKFMKSTLEHGFPWIFWLQPGVPWSSYKLLFSCTTAVESDIRVGNRMRIETGPEARAEWIMLIFHNLNMFTENNNLSEDINREMSGNLHSFIVSEFVTD